MEQDSKYLYNKGTSYICVLWIICDYIAVISDYVLISLVVFVEIHLLIKVHTVVTLTSRS